MPGMGLEAAFGADNVSQRIRQRIKDQLEAQQQQHRMGLDDQMMQLRQQEAARAAEEFKLTLKDREAAAADRRTQAEALTGLKEDQAATTAFTNNPVGAPLSPRLALRGRMIGLPVNTVPGVAGPAAVQGLASLDAPMAGDPLTPESTPESYTRGATQADVERQNTDAFNQRKFDEGLAATTAEHDRQRADRADLERQRQSDKQENLKLAASLRPPSTAGEKLTRVEHKDPETGRTVIEYLPQSALKGTKFEKGVLGATESRLASAEAVKQTGDDMIANLNTPEVRAKLGPVMGRFNTLKDFIGNPPPEFAELAGQIESYSLANMGVHGMRSAQGSRMIAQLLDQHHTPESLIASIKGLNSFAVHFMENEGRGGAAKAPASNAAPAADGGLPTVGSTFQGGKVLKVEKVK